MADPAPLALADPRLAPLLELTKKILPYILLLPTSLLTLPITVLLHLTTTPSLSPVAFLRNPLCHPLHLPLILLFNTIPVIYLLGLITGKISWVDKIWPFYTPLCSALMISWLASNPQATVYGHNAPRLVLMLALQVVWMVRLNAHAMRRGFYEVKSEDYRYTALRKVIPKPIWSLVHLFAVAIFQPTLLFALALPVQAVLLLPPSELSTGPFNLYIPFSTIKPFLPETYHSAPDSTPILNLSDLFISLLALGCVYLEYAADAVMFAFQEAKHNPPPGTPMVQPKHTNPPNYPPAAAYPAHLHPGFPTKGLWRWSRHPNFAGEQVFWTTQALFVSVAAESSGVTRSGWMGGDVWGPCLTLSLLFTGSTFITEWITAKKYPLYSEYRKLVGQFLPQETLLVRAWSTIRGTRAKAAELIYGPAPSGQLANGAPPSRAPEVERPIPPKLKVTRPSI